ncbi:MAG TPA: type II toxin-antitoxin system RelE/ParE family toxin [Chthoniobacterales bacterium]|nr:type II toxin-antitoxin system RelE/ParE family toxin [Chthoniobacterales bacterium]
MIREIIFRPAAVDDVVAAAAWYEAHAPGLGEELINEILRATNRAQANPELFRIVRGDGPVRRALTERFPYRIFFSLVSDTLYVHAVLHGARHDRRWRERL